MTARMDIPLLEVCVDSPAAALAAEEGGADRVELCAGLSEGGTTPSLGAIERTREQITIDLFVLVRPRPGDFLHTASELEVMERDIELCRAAGAQGVVLGLLLPDGRIDRERTARLVAAARPLQVTFHRAFDMSRAPEQGLETLVELGVERVLSSGAERTALAGARSLRRLVRQAGERITILAGGGIRAENVRQLLELSGAREIHFTAREPVSSGMRFRNPRCAMGSGPPPSEYEGLITQASLVRRLRSMVSLGEDTPGDSPPEISGS